MSATISTNPSVFYQKRKNSELFKSLERPEILFLSKPQNYIPIYNRFFSLNETNFNNINLNHNHYLHNIKSKIDPSKNLFQCRIKNIKNDKVKDKNIFIKLAPLLDPFKFLVGKYNNVTDEKLCTLPSLNLSNVSCHACHDKLLDINNSAYVDGFFVYLTSILKNDFKFNHGLDYYGSFMGIKNNYVLNIFDDLEYLSNSDFFNKNKNVLFKIDDYTHLFKNEKQKLKSIKINYNSSAKSELTINSINNEIYDNLFVETDSIERKHEQSYPIENIDASDVSDFKLENEYENDHDHDHDHGHNHFDNHTKITTLKTSSTCSSRISYTNSELSNDDVNNSSEYDSKYDDGEHDDECGSDDEVGAGSESGSGSEYESFDSEDDLSSVEEEEINATISKFPVQLICMENCERTFDELIFKNEIDNDEWLSALMQIIMILITYQKSFSFTHNDLHTNNIMYNETSKKFITYCYNKTVYKVPTFGRLFKIIDFGRSIYKFQGNLFCSDSFQAGNDAASQYNTEPYFDDKKPRLEPNFSFDLSRLACSIFDYLVEDLDEIKDITKITDPVKKIIVEWCLDDKGINLLYKNNGDERYPDFKLYKMIARHVHNHTPQSQLERPEFSQFSVQNINANINENEIDINIDKIPILC